MRKPFQGSLNIIRFNWPFYIVSLGAILLLFLVRAYSNPAITMAIDVLLFLVIVPMVVSLLVSLYVYDLSGFYELNWLNRLRFGVGERIVNVNAGFDETSLLLQEKFVDSEIIVLDFYDPKKHTAPSIRRARNAYPPFPDTQKISTGHLPLEDDLADKIFVIMAAHEIRDSAERCQFFKELERTLAPDGQIAVIEHLRDAANYFAYNVGAFHFHSRASWLETFAAANLEIESEITLTPFVSAFFLRKHGTAS